MLTQLSRLSVAADGRYAKLEELQFLKGYFQSLDLRVSAYEKIRAAEAEILNQAEAKMRALDPHIFRIASGDITKQWRRDVVQLLRYASAALLFNDHDRLREGLLIWHNTIAKSYQFDRTCNMSFDVMPDVVEQYLTPQEAALFRPILALNNVLLG